MANTVLVTGASSGIGRATALHFQQQGWNVAATMRTPEKETALTGLPRVICPALDVTREDSIAAAVQLGEPAKVTVSAAAKVSPPFEDPPLFEPPLEPPPSEPLPLMA